MCVCFGCFVVCKFWVLGWVLVVGIGEGRFRSWKFLGECLVFGF